MTGDGDSANPTTRAGAFTSDERFASLRGISSRARHELSDAVWNYLWTGVGDEVTARRNTRRFDDLLWDPSLFSGVGQPETSTTFLGLDLAFPVLTAPFGFEGNFHPDGHVAVARAAADVGVAQIVPEAASFTLEEIAAASPAALFYQLAVMGDVERALRHAERAKAAGYRFLVAAYVGAAHWRERLIEDRFENRYGALPAPEGLDGDGSDPSGAADPYARWTWTELREFISLSPLPVLVKGVMSAREALASVDVGAAALYVSNFGGRNLDRTLAAIEVLPAIRAAVGDDVPILFDSGIRRGSDVAAALALGADVVAIGRLTALGLAAGGEGGVRRTLELLHEELVATMGHLGCRSVADLDARFLVDTGSG